jgi:guanylate kinase
MKTGRLFIISAPSGTGKSTVVAEVRRRLPELDFSISYTTRQPRGAERDGREYHFVERAAFERMIAEGAFAEWAQVHGNFYGTPCAPLDEAMASGRDILLDIDVQGGMSIKHAYPEAVAVFFLPPSFDELRKRLSGRKTDTPEQIKIRLENAQEELAFKDKYDVLIVNDEVEKAADELVQLIVRGPKPKNP